MEQLAYSLLPVRRFFAKHHAVVFVSISTLLLALAIFMLYNVLTTATSDSTTTQTSSLGGFDQQTIDKIKKLHDSSDSSDTLVFPSSHPNPFAE